MTDDITARIAAKGCKATGIDDDTARALHRHLGTKRMAIVELVSNAKTEKADGTETVILNIITIEPAPTPATEDHLRELQRAFYYERGIEDGQRALDASIEPKVSDVLEQGARFQPHPYLSSMLAIDGPTPVCDVCGLAEQANVHDQHRGDNDDDGVDEADEPHAYEDNQQDGSCRICGRDDDDDTPGIHVTDDEDAHDNVTHLPTIPDPFTPNSA